LVRGSTFERANVAPQAFASAGARCATPSPIRRPPSPAGATAGGTSSIPCAPVVKRVWSASPFMPAISATATSCPSNDARTGIIALAAAGVYRGHSLCSLGPFVRSPPG